MLLRFLVVLCVTSWAWPAWSAPCGHRGSITHLRASGPEALEMCMDEVERSCWSVDLDTGAFTSIAVAESSQVIAVPEAAEADLGSGIDDDPVALRFRACHPQTKVCKRVLKPKGYRNHAVTGDGKYIVVGKMTLERDDEYGEVVNVPGLVETLRWEDLKSVAKVKDKWIEATVTSTGPLVEVDYIDCEGVDCDGTSLYKADTLKQVAGIGFGRNMGGASFLPLKGQGNAWLVLIGGTRELKSGLIVRTSHAAFYDEQRSKLGKIIDYGSFLEKKYRKRRRRPKRDFEIYEEISWNEGPGYMMVPTTNGTVAAVINSEFDDGITGDIGRFTSKGQLKYFRFPDCPDKLPAPSPAPTKEKKVAAMKGAEPDAPVAMREHSGIWRGGGVTVRAEGRGIVMLDRKGRRNWAKGYDLLSDYEDKKAMESFKITSASVEGGRTVRVEFDWEGKGKSGEGSVRHVFK